MLESDVSYVAFEEQFRGTRKDIKGRVSVYLPLIRNLTRTLVDPGLRVVDIGCGRGEWLEVLFEAGVSAYGCDTNEAMASRCAENGLDVTVGDALSHLRGLPPDSLAAVTGFHIIEHLQFPDVEALLTESFRAIHPGGIVIFETPNPENLCVGGHWFYMDPTHIRPLPPELVRYLARSAGFSVVEMVKLHPDDRLTSHLDDAITPFEQDVTVQLFGPRDYAVVAMKEAGGEHSDVRAHIEALSKEAEPVFVRAPSRSMRLQQELDEARQQLVQLYASRSWRLTAPLRWMETKLRAIEVVVKDLIMGYRKPNG